MSDTDDDYSGQIPPDLGGYSPAPVVQPVVIPAHDEPTSIPWTVPAEDSSRLSETPIAYEESSQYAAAPGEPTTIEWSVPYEDSLQGSVTPGEPTTIEWSVPPAETPPWSVPPAVYEESPQYSAAADEPTSLPLPDAVYEESSQRSVTPDGPMSIDIGTSFDDSGQADVDADQHQWVAAQVDRFSGLGPFEHMGKSTVQRMYEDGSDLPALKAVASALDHRGHGSDPQVSNDTHFVEFDDQLSRLLLGLDDQWQSSAKHSTTDDLIATAAALAADQGVQSQGESFNHMHLKIVTDELNTRYNEEIDGWLNSVPTRVAEQRIAEMFRTATVAGDVLLEASAQAVESRLHDRVFHASVKALSQVSLDDLGARIQELHGTTGIAERAELDAIRFHVEMLSRESVSDLWMDRNGRQGTRVELGRVETLEAYERGAAANQTLVGAIIYNRTGNADLAIAISGLLDVAGETQIAHTSHQQMNASLGAARQATVLDMRQAREQRPADRPHPITEVIQPEVIREWTPEAAVDHKWLDGAPFGGSPWTKFEAEKFQLHFRSFGDGPTTPEKYQERFDERGEPRGQAGALGEFHGGGVASRLPNDSSSWGVRCGNGTEARPWFIQVFSGLNGQKEATKFAKQLQESPPQQSPLGVPPDGNWPGGGVSTFSHVQVVEILRAEGRGAATWRGVAAPQVGANTFATGGAHQILCAAAEFGKVTPFPLMPR